MAPNAGVRIIPGPWIQAKNLCRRICPWGVVPGIFGAKSEKPALVKYIPAVAAPSVAWRSRPEAVPCRPAAPEAVRIVASKGAAVIKPSR